MDGSFISCALNEVRRGLIGTMSLLGGDRAAATLTKTLARHIRSRLKALEVILRRLIVLMALNLSLEPLKRRTPVEATHDDPDGPILTKSVQTFCLSLSGRLHVFAVDEPELSGSAGAVPGEETLLPLQLRAEAIARVLKDPVHYAIRVARVLDRRRKAGEPAPDCAPMTRTTRLHPELSMVASGLPQMLAEAFTRWEGSG